MKLASYKDGTRDGQLVVVSRDLAQAHYATGVANRLQTVLEDWNFFAPQLQDLSDALNAGRASHPFVFDPTRCLAPLPRSFGWIEANAYAHPADQPEPSHDDRITVHAQAGGAWAGARDPWLVADGVQGLDLAAQVAVITADVPVGTDADAALDRVRLLMLANVPRWDEHNIAPDATTLGNALVPAFSPVAVTSDELGDAWRDGRLHLPLKVALNGRKIGLCDAGVDMRAGFGQLIAMAAHRRALEVGTVLGSGAVHNGGVGEGADRRWPKGASTIAARRAIETCTDGAAKTRFLCIDDTVRVDMKGLDGRSVFGAIEQKITGPS